MIVIEYLFVFGLVSFFCLFCNTCGYSLCDARQLLLKSENLNFCIDFWRVCHISSTLDIRNCLINVLNMKHTITYPKLPHIFFFYLLHYSSFFYIIALSLNIFFLLCVLCCCYLAEPKHITHFFLYFLYAPWPFSTQIDQTGNLQVTSLLLFLLKEKENAWNISPSQLKNIWLVPQWDRSTISCMWIFRNNSPTGNTDACLVFALKSVNSTRMTSAAEWSEWHS